MSKIADFAALSDGYIGPGSVAPTREVIRHLAELEEIPARALAVPTAEGAVSIGWRDGDVEFTAQILPDDKLFMCTDNVVTDELHETEIDFRVDTLRSFLHSGVWS